MPEVHAQNDAYHEGKHAIFLLIFHYYTDHKSTPPSHVMDLLPMLENSIWHAFTSLDSDQHGNVTKSRLKVLTQNLGTLLDLADQKVEAGISEFRSTPTLTFEHYKYYLTHEVFSRLPADLTPDQLRVYHEAVEDTCWVLYRPTAMKRDMPTLARGMRAPAVPRLLLSW
ncbi:differentially expressed in FDCP 6 homolog [Pollicipes pollicipes]|uniref:differentially expressed in FDCP 6 homolog n=1 Tax=Pollicipes pollicipes TaxID=41117 RepID=UPI001884A9A1|nr:differentially expressed in FDCP 6 homolog [Pollicipes pollicipes]